jgi:hypothetical protein
MHTSLTTSPGYYDVLSIAYGSDLGLLMLILAIFTLAVTRDKRKPIGEDLSKQFKIEAVFFFFSGLVFFGSALVPLAASIFGVPIRFDLWIVPLLIGRARRRNMRVINEVRKLRTKRESSAAKPSD